MKHPHLSRRLGAALVAAVLSVSLASCASEGAPAGPAETIPVTLPDLTDDRTPTSTDAYAETLDTAFAETPVAPASDFTYTVADEGVTVTGYTGGEVVLLLPDTIEDKPVVAIAEGAFAGMGNLNAIALPDTVTTVAAGALEGCSSLATLRTPVCVSPDKPYFGALFGAESHEINDSAVPASLKTLILTAGTAIPDYCFYDCPMEVVSLPATVTELGAFAFYGCDRLAYIPTGHTAMVSVGDWAFTNCTSLLSLELPATVDIMGQAMLEGCGALETLAIPFVGARRPIAEAPAEEGDETEATTYTDHLGYLFGAMDYTHSAGFIPASLIRVTVRPGCSEIPANAFFECSSIREILLPEGVTAIGRRAFYGCEKLSAMIIPDSTTTIGDDAFHGCIRLVDLTVGAGLETLGVQVFMDCLSLQTVTLPASVTSLPNSTFAGCRSLESLTAPGVTSVGRQVFRHCDKLSGWDAYK